MAAAAVRRGKVCGRAGRVATVRSMAPKPPSISSPPPDSVGPASAEAAAAAELEKKLRDGVPVAGADAKSAGRSPRDDDDETDVDDEEDEDLVVFTAKEAAGALATIYAF